MNHTMIFFTVLNPIIEFFIECLGNPIYNIAVHEIKGLL